MHLIAAAPGNAIAVRRKEQCRSWFHRPKQFTSVRRTEAPLSKRQCEVSKRHHPLPFITFSTLGQEGQNAERTSRTGTVSAVGEETEFQSNKRSAAIEEER
jgi:hypothetical protein